MDTNLVRAAAQQQPPNPGQDTKTAYGGGTAPASPAAPEIPEKFRDPQTGELRVEALLKSYQALERKLARMVEVPDDNADENARLRFRRAMGVPDRPEDYAVKPPSDLVQPDADVNRVLHAAGLTPTQAQVVYNLAAERMVPAVNELAREFEADRQMERLVAHFGSAEKWREVAGALRDWGRKNLPDEVFTALSTTFEGVVAMHRMMTSEEPGLSQAGHGAGAVNEDELRRLMADPKYWRDRDPATVKKVSDGFKKLFPDANQR
jgi:hypothetical protein